MTDRTPQQVDMTLDRVEQISAQNTVNIAELQTYVSQFVRAVDQRLGSVDRQLQSVDQQLQVQNERIARQDTLIQLLSTYITGTPPQAD
jgi:ABC-type transporter Mla subunit MlaD